MTDGNDGQKPAASSANAKLNALAEAAAAATSQSGLRSRRQEDNGSAHYDSDIDEQQPAEVTPNNTFESSIEHAAASSSSAASTDAARPSAAVGNSALTSDPSCPWKNRQDLLALWKKRYSELLTYRQQHGHANVPQRYEANPELGRWVKDQRAFRRNNKLNSERIKLLDDLGFVWKIKKPNDFWMEKLHQLKEYKRTQGNLHPPREGEHKTLACWVDRQRRAGKSGKLTSERVRLLNEVGFIWDPRGDGGSDTVVGNHEVSFELVMSTIFVIWISNPSFT
ncbi:hypothetical protein HJC23_012463 [Cyclotella cryptica]|uniref:Helicase-associated domain-containing protein n=1 Tax=Cyclotella cryptica TaxID=29204 RepID=A0ABD3P5V2_9STRA